MLPMSIRIRFWFTTPTRLKLKRRIGTGGHKHELTTPGDFARPAGLAVDRDGNLYVADTLNNRIEIFDGDGKFVSTFGKAGDGPGYFCAAQRRRHRQR